MVSSCHLHRGIGAFAKSQKYYFHSIFKEKNNVKFGQDWDLTVAGEGRGGGFWITNHGRISILSASNTQTIKLQKFQVSRKSPECEGIFTNYATNLGRITNQAKSISTCRPVPNFTHYVQIRGIYLGNCANLSDYKLDGKFTLGLFHTSTFCLNQLNFRELYTALII